MNKIKESVAGQNPTSTAAAPEPYQPPYLAALVAAVGVFILYAITLAPTTQFWDASEYIATADILGIPHPPGNPLFVVLAGAWKVVLAPTGLDVAARVNLFSAFMSALTHGFWFLIAHRILSYYSTDTRFRLVGAAAAVIMSATAFTVWNQSNVNEKVYTVSLFTIGLISWLAFRWRERLGEGKDDNLLLLVIFILALSVGNHLMALLAAPALVLFVLLISPRTLLNWRLLFGGAAVALLGLSIHLFLPLRAALDPIINEADPSNWQGLWESLTRQQYDKPSILDDPINRSLPRGLSLIAAQFATYLQYFDWQWSRSVAGPDSWFGGFRPVITLAIVGLGLFGAWTHYLRDRISWAYVALLFATLSVGLVIYLNFKYGYTYPGMDITREMREVRERDYFFIGSFSLWGVWSGIGLAALWQRLADLFRAAGLGARSLLVSSPILIFALVPAVLNWSWATRAHDYAARDWAYNLLMSVEPYGLLFTNGDNDTFPLWYLQEVEGLRQDVTVMVSSYLNTPWYVKQIRDLTTPCPEGVDPTQDRTRIICQRPFRPDQAPAFYAESEWASHPPQRAALAMSPEEIDSVTGAFAADMYSFYLPRPLQVTADSLEFTVPGGRILPPSQFFMLHMIQNSMGDRPIYFASTTAEYEGLGLADHLIREGVAYRVADGPVQTVDEDPESGIVRMPEGQDRAATGPYFNLPRTEALLWDVFVHRGGIPDEWNHWVDAATSGIPFYYGFTHFGAARANSIVGNEEAAQRHMERWQAWSRLGDR